MPVKTSTPGGAEPRRRRAKLSLSERLEDVDASIRSHEQALAKLRQKRADLIEAERTRVALLQTEIESATSPQVRRDVE